VRRLGSEELTGGDAPWTGTSDTVLTREAGRRVRQPRASRQFLKMFRVENPQRRAHRVQIEGEEVIEAIARAGPRSQGPHPERLPGEERRAVARLHPGLSLIVMAQAKERTFPGRRVS